MGVLDEVTSLIKVREPPKKMPRTEVQPVVSALPFPRQFSKSQKEESEKELLNTFRKVQVNIPLLDAIKQVPRYAKFLMELRTNKRKLKGDEKVRGRRMCLQCFNENFLKSVRIRGPSPFCVQLARTDLRRLCLIWGHQSV